MKELSLNILDITENSLKANASLVSIKLSEDTEWLVIEITDNGDGMTEQTLKTVSDPFYTTRTTRKVGMGIPLFKLAAEQTGGRVDITSRHKDDFPGSHGTSVIARFNKNHIDFTPIGDVISTMVTLIQGHPDADFSFSHINESREVMLDTRALREILGDVPLNSYEVLLWIQEHLMEQYEGFN